MSGSLRGKIIQARHRTDAAIPGLFYKQRGFISAAATIRGNEELAGFLLAENMVKAQVYSEYAGVGKSMGKDIRQAFQRLINFYLEPGSDRHGAQAPH